MKQFVFGNMITHQRNIERNYASILAFPYFIQIGWVHMPAEQNKNNDNFFFISQSSFHTINKMAVYKKKKNVHFITIICLASINIVFLSHFKSLLQHEAKGQVL